MAFLAGMTNEEYHAHPAMSKTKLDLFNRDENLLAWAENCPVDEEKMKTLDFGDAMHAICLEPERLQSEFVVMPKFNLRTNQGKEDKAGFEKENQGKKILNDDEYTKLRLMYESVMAHPAARQIIEGKGIAEGSFFWTDKDSGIECRCRPDKIMTEFGFSVDIKTTEQLSKFKFSVDDFRYYVQDPYYRDGMASNGITHHEMRFLVIQKTIECGRYPCMVVTLPQEVVEYGRQEYRRNLMEYAEFLERNTFNPSQELEMHHWFTNKIHDDSIEGIY